MAVCVLKYILSLLFVSTMCSAKEISKDPLDKLIEDEITVKLSDDLLQSVEKKFHVDLERSVDSVLSKIKLLLHNGTMHIQERLVHLQDYMQDMRNNSGSEVDRCLLEKQAETTTLAEKALHQMVVCGYALIGHDPAQAVRSIIELKAMIRHGLKPLYDNKHEILELLKVCGHDHETLKSVIKCVMSKSPLLKSAMMEISSKLIDGVVHLTKQMAHGAMHEACLIEVINTVEEEAFEIVKKVKDCAKADDNKLQKETETFIRENNATILDVKTPAELRANGEDAKDAVKDTDDQKTGFNNAKENDQNVNAKEYNQMEAGPNLMQNVGIDENKEGGARNSI